MANETTQTATENKPLEAGKYYAKISNKCKFSKYVFTLRVACDSFMSSNSIVLSGESGAAIKLDDWLNLSNTFDDDKEYYTESTKADFEAARKEALKRIVDQMF